MIVLSRECLFGHCLFQDDKIDLYNEGLDDDEVSRRLRDKDKTSIKT